MPLMTLIVGRTASGKDLLASTLEKRYGFRRLVSYTTRPQRKGEPDDSHRFVTEEEASHLVHAVSTTINGYDYFATPPTIRHADTYVIDPIGVKNLFAAGLETMSYIVVNLQAPLEVRRARSVARLGELTEDEQKDAVVAFDDRNDAEDEEFTAFEREMLDWGKPDGAPSSQLALAITTQNATDDTASIDELAMQLDFYRNLYRNAETMVRFAKYRGLFKKDSASYKDPDATIRHIMSDPATFGELAQSLAMVSEMKLEPDKPVITAVNDLGL